VRFPENVRGLWSGFPRNTRNARGQIGRKFLPLAASIAGVMDPGECKNPIFHWLFQHGTGLADVRAVKLRPQHRGICRSSAMLLALGAVSSALDALQSLTAPNAKSAPTTGFSQNASNPFDLSGSTPASLSPTPASGASGVSQLSPSTMSTLLAAQGQSSTTTTASAPTSQDAALNDLFSKIDANGDGQISKSEFESALGAGGTNLSNADSVFSKMDKNGDGSISLNEMSSALKGGKGHGHHHAGGSSGSSASTGAAGSSSDPLLQALDGASSTSTSNSDGSTTTSVTYADGSKVTMTSPAAKAASASATSSYNFIEQMISREAQAISSGATASLSVTA
jgi:Ca2+-binding EF-hand superfamily protein